MQEFVHCGFGVRSHSDCLFAGFAGCHDPIYSPRNFIEPKTGSLGDGFVANDDAVAATSTRVKAG
jgi:hypothetical protein